MKTLFEKKIERLKKERLKRLIPELERSLFRVMPIYTGFFTEENQMQISERSKRVDESKITRLGFPDSYVYSPTYKGFKAKLGGNTDRIDLKLKGNYLNSINYQVLGYELIADASDSKSPLLDFFYAGESKLIGLNQQTKKAFLSDAYFQIKILIRL